MAIKLTLQGGPEASAGAVHTAINRFRRELHRKLGDRAEAALKAYQNASESSAEDVTKEEHRLTSDYAAAYDAARTAGFRDLGDARGVLRRASCLSPGRAYRPQKAPGGDQASPPQPWTANQKGARGLRAQAPRGNPDGVWFTSAS